MYGVSLSWPGRSMRWIRAIPARPITATLRAMPSRTAPWTVVSSGVFIVASVIGNLPKAPPRVAVCRRPGGVSSCATGAAAEPAHYSPRCAGRPPPADANATLDAYLPAMERRRDACPPTQPRDLYRAFRCERRAALFRPDDAADERFAVHRRAAPLWPHVAT